MPCFFNAVHRSVALLNELFNRIHLVQPFHRHPHADCYCKRTVFLVIQPLKRFLKGCRKRPGLFSVRYEYHILIPTDSGPCRPHQQCFLNSPSHQSNSEITGSMAMLTWAFIKYGGVRTLGLCHGEIHGEMQIADVLGVKDRR